jgi:hypothetical protein
MGNCHSKDHGETSRTSENSYSFGATTVSACLRRALRHRPAHLAPSSLSHIFGHEKQNTASQGHDERRIMDKIATPAKKKWMSEFLRGVDIPRYPTGAPTTVGEVG